MFEYKSEILNISPKLKGLKIVKYVIDHADTAKLDRLIAERAAEGWELVAHSSIVDIVTARFNMIVTFKRAK